ncbi:hypothetical protein GQ600_13122 [Phytophthora cactorum]|nr:hypothetical protein GQ600_13122 [Phytophthora cactorum]
MLLLQQPRQLLHLPAVGILQARHRSLHHSCHSHHTDHIPLGSMCPFQSNPSDLNPLGGKWRRATCCPSRLRTIPTDAPGISISIHLTTTDRNGSSSVGSTTVASTAPALKSLRYDALIRIDSKSWVDQTEHVLIQSAG